MKIIYFSFIELKTKKTHFFLKKIKIYFLVRFSAISIQQIHSFELLL